MGSNVHNPAWGTMIETAFTPQRFCKAFVAALVLRGERVLEPKRASDRRGFRSMIKELEAQVARARSNDESQRPWYKQLVRLRNELYPSNNGAFDALEMTLRDLQTSAVSCPNPDYDYISFDISPIFASSILDGLSEPERVLAKAAAEAFGSAKGGTQLSGALA